MYRHCNSRDECQHAEIGLSASHRPSRPTQHSDSAYGEGRQVNATASQAQLLIDCANTFGACARWSERHQRVFWTDVDEQLLYSASAYGTALETIPLPDRLSAFAFDQLGRLVCAFFDGVYLFDLETGERRQIASFEPRLPTTRTNDGSCDRDGWFVVGGCEQSSGQPLSSIRSYAMDDESILIRSIGRARGIAFSLTGETMYFADETHALIYRLPYQGMGNLVGQLGKPTAFAELRVGEGNPGGSCVDSEDALWSAQFGGHAVQRFLQDGTRDARVHVPVAHVTSCCFGGPKLDVMFITTARAAMTHAQLKTHPSAGGLFVATPDALGVPEALFDSTDGRYFQPAWATLAAGKRFLEPRE